MPLHRSRRAAVLLGAVLVGGLVTSAQAGWAAPPPRHDKPSAGSTFATQEVWTDLYGSGNLTSGLLSLIGQAAVSSTIDLKTYYFHDDGPLPHSVVTALKAAHTSRHVTVNVIAQRKVGYTTKEWASFRKTMSFASVHWCNYSCTADPVTDSVTHSKFVTFSNLTGAATTAVVETGSNISQQQLGRTIQSAVVFRDNPAAYRVFSQAWDRTLACTKGTCAQAARPVTTPVAPQTGVIFAPFVGRGPWTTDVMRQHAQPGCRIFLSTITFHDDALANALIRLQSEGCDVRLVIEHHHSADLTDPLRPKGGRSHDKVLVMHNGARNIAYVGSADFTYGAYHLNNQQMLVSTNQALLADYDAWADQIWASPRLTLWPITAKASPSRLAADNPED